MLRVFRTTLKSAHLGRLIRLARGATVPRNTLNITEVFSENKRCDSLRTSIKRGFAMSAVSKNPMNQSMGAIGGDFEALKGKPNPAMDAVAKLGIPGVTIIRDEKEARRVIEILKTLKDRVHAWDTETIDLEVREESPVGKGKIMCFTGFCGPDVDFGTGPRLFVDNMSSKDDLVQVFKEYFEDENYLKGWFNYGFDRHIFYNHGVDVK